MAQILHWLIRKQRPVFTNRVMKTEWSDTRVSVPSLAQTDNNRKNCLNADTVEGR